MNRLQHETSPYLLQHASNPVDWYPWGEEALERARKEDKPIIVSIGYSTCHWCHVMERESFEDDAVAAYMNEHYVCIKVDREERPDVDQVYMEACQAISGGGGWPLNAFLLPDGRPFYAGTYYPPQSAHNRPGWIDLLRHFVRLYHEERAKVEEQANGLTDSIGKAPNIFITDELTAEDPFDAEKMETMVATLRSRFDLTNGGFGGAPKFPMSQSLELLLDHGLLTDNDSSLALARKGMSAMIRGGIYDQIGGGFARYTVDGAWRVPHFEKMLYDNGLLLRLLGKLQLSGPDPEWVTTIEETVGWLKREMRSPSGSFYAALDADSEGVEGKFYVWDYDELELVLGQDRLTQAERFFGVSKAGNWAEEQTNIFYRSAPVPAVEATAFDETKKILFDHRENRIRPGRDEKIILQWNALLISGLTYCYRATGEQEQLDLATKSLSALRRECFHEGQWYRNFTAGRRGTPAYLDDLAALAEALLDLYAVTFDFALLEEAMAITEDVLNRFSGAEGGLFYLRPLKGNELPVATVDLYDNALPSGNSQLLNVLHRLAQMSGRQDWASLLDERLTQMVGGVTKYPTSFANWGRLLLLKSRKERELVVTGPGSRAAARELGKKYWPDLVIVATETDRPDFPSLKDRYLDDRRRFFLCENQSCHQPVDSVDELPLALR